MFEMRHETVLVLRACNYNNCSHGGFQWPREGPVEAPDWDPTPVCGGGLHGWLWGEGNGDLGNWDSDALWLVVEVEASTVVDLGGKVKFPRGIVVFCGDRQEATAYIVERAPWAVVIGATLTVGHRAIVVGGDYATVTGGYHATVIGGDDAIVTGSCHACVVGGDRATVVGGHSAIVTGGSYATVTGGDRATVTGGHRAVVTGGHNATVTGGWGSTVVGGDYAVVVGGCYAVVRGGNGAILCINYLGRNYRAIVGDNGINPDVFYRLVNGVFTVSETGSLEDENI